MTGVAKGVRHARLFSARCHLRRIPDTLPVHPIGDVPDRLYRRETWVNRTETGRLAATGGAKAVGAAQRSPTNCDSRQSTEGALQP